ncbi:MAG TPA: hypothetical protein VG710_03705 [Opitutus sp.]|nr:hypothetical protein [Opitutus sp.]
MEKRHLTRLAPEFYRGHAFVHWTLTIEARATGWLSSTFHSNWKLLLLHASTRYRLISPTYVLMPDHVHLLWLGLADEKSDQGVAVEFLRKHLRCHLAPADWQRQPFDHVLTGREREHGAFLTVAGYILDNPVRAGLIAERSAWPYSGCCVPGYPDLNPHKAEYWELFWRIYNRLIEGR